MALIFDDTQFLKDRKKAFTEAIMNDNWKPFKEYCVKYGIDMVEDETVVKGAVYKAVQECTDIPDSVKEVAMVKCFELGFIARRRTT